MVHFKYTSIKFFVTMLAATFLLTGCWPFEKRELKLHVINVLDEDTYNDCHIKGSINIPFDEFDEDLDDVLERLDKHDHYVLYCTNYSCTSSMYIAKLLKDHGYDHVWEYGGGMADWYQQSLPVQGPCTQEYLKAENKPLQAHSDNVPNITAQQLQQKMKEFGIVEHI